jgi:putative hemolysin
MIFFYLFLCLVLIGFLSGLEIGFLSANKIGLEHKKKQGDRSAKLLSQYVENPAHFIGGSVMGVAILLVVFSVLSLHVFHNYLPFLHNNALALFGVSSFIVLLVVLLLGDLLSKNIFKTIGERTIVICNMPIRFLYFLLNGINNSLQGVAAFVLKYLFNVKIDNTKKAFAPIDLEQYERQLKTGKDENHQDVNVELFENALELSNIRIRECLIPRNEIQGVDITTPIEEVKELFIESKHSKLLVYENDLDNIIGYIHHLDFYKKQLHLKELIHKIPAVPEAMHAVELLNNFTKNRKSIAWVVDEFGGTAGIVTMEDLLEEIFGEIEDEHDENEYIEKQISKNEYILSGRLEVEYINEKFDLEIPSENAETLSGYIIEEHNAIPAQKDKILLGNYEFDILLVTKTRIETVKLKVLDNDD